MTLRKEVVGGFNNTAGSTVSGCHFLPPQSAKHLRSTAAGKRERKHALSAGRPAPLCASSPRSFPQAFHQ